MINQKQATDLLTDCEKYFQSEKYQFVYKMDLSDISRHNEQPIKIFRYQDIAPISDHMAYLRDNVNIELFVSEDLKHYPDFVHAVILTK